MLLLALPALFGCSGALDGVTVFAAASTREAVAASAAAFEANGGGPVITSFAASSTLARQIEAGAPADLFLSANTRWMDALEEQGLLERGSRRDLLSGELVLIGPRQPAFEGLVISLTPGADLPDLPGLVEGCIAMGDPEHVPAGIYGKAALERLGWWEALADRVLPAADVRAALTLVQRGECPLGIVYASDLAAGGGGVTRLGGFPSETSPPVVYPAAQIEDAAPGAAALLDFLSGLEAAAAFADAGFTHLGARSDATEARR